MKVASAAFALVFLVATEAHTSGSYGNSIASPSFRYTFVENVRKSFVDAEQGRGYMEEHDRDMKVRFLGFQAKAEKAIKASGAPFAPFDLFLPAVRLKRAIDVAKIDRKAYPLNLVIDVSTERADERFEVTATRPWSAAQVTSLTAQLKRLAHKAPNNEFSDERDAKEKALLEGAAFEAPVAVTHVDEGFGVYVGTTTEVAAADRPRVLATMQARLDGMVPVLRASFALPDVAARLGVEGLQPVAPLVEKHPQKLPGAFHPWGPLVSGELVRVSEPLGHVSTILMIAPRGKYEWSKLHPVMTTLLREAGAADAHAELVEREAERLSGEER